MRAFPLWAVLAASCWVALPGHAQDAGYRWVDADGVTHYTQTPPPPGVSFDKVVSKAQKPPNAASEVAAATSDASTPADVETAEQKTACENARRNVTLLSGDGPVRAARPVAAADGKTSEVVGEQLNPEQRAKELRRAKLQVELNCE